MERHEWESRCDCHVRNLVKHQVNVCDSRCTCSLHEEWVTDIWLFTAGKLMVLRNSVIVFHEEKEWTASQHDLVTRTLAASSLSGLPFCASSEKCTYLQNHSLLSCRTTSSITSIASIALPRRERRHAYQHYNSSEFFFLRHGAKWPLCLRSPRSQATLQACNVFSYDCWGIHFISLSGHLVILPA